MNLFSVGVSPRYRKSARKPSKEIKIVVGANSEVPLDTIVAALTSGLGVETRYAAASRMTKRTMMAMYVARRRHSRDRRAYVFIRF